MDDDIAMLINSINSYDVLKELDEKEHIFKVGDTKWYIPTSKIEEYIDVVLARHSTLIINMNNLDKVYHKLLWFDIMDLIAYFSLNMELMKNFTKRYISSMYIAQWIDSKVLLPETGWIYKRAKNEFEGLSIT